MLQNEGCEDALERTSFAEKEQLIAMIEKTIADPASETLNLSKTLLIFDLYQEIPQLLDPHLAELIDPILAHLTAKIEVFPEQSDHWKNVLCNESYPLFVILYRIAKTRGPKTIVNFFTHNVTLLEPAIDFLQFVMTFAEKWETRYIMLLWCSLIVMTPFDLTSIETTPGLFKRILELAKYFSALVGAEYQTASVLLMRLMTRKDSYPLLIEFVNNCFDALQDTPLFEVIFHVTKDERVFDISFCDLQNRTARCFKGNCW